MPTGNRMDSSPSVILPEVMRTGMLNGQPYPIKSLYVFQGNPVACHVDQNTFMRDVIDKMEFIVTADLEMNDTARASDIVLPAAHFYEVDELVHNCVTSPYLQFSEKAVDPPFEAKGDADITRLLANAMGVGEYFNKTDDEYFWKSSWIATFAGNWALRWIG